MTTTNNSRIGGFRRNSRVRFLKGATAAFSRYADGNHEWTVHYPNGFGFVAVGDYQIRDMWEVHLIRQEGNSWVPVGRPKLMSDVARYRSEEGVCRVAEVIRSL